jgi:hypothetical protein
MTARPYPGTMPTEEIVARYAAYGLQTTCAELVRAHTGVEIREQTSRSWLLATPFGPAQRVLDDLEDACADDAPNIPRIWELCARATAALADADAMLQAAAARAFAGTARQ